MPNPGPIFVGGVNRSGTTLMRQILGSHSRIAIPPTDVDFFVQPGGCAQPVADSDELVRRVEAALDWPKMGAWRLDRAQLLETARRVEPNSRSLMLVLLGQYARQAGRPLPAQKTPHYEAYARELDAWFGDGYRFVQLVRHPFDTYASGRWYAGRERSAYAEGWAAGWVRSATVGLGRAVTHPRVHRVIRYEDLVSRPHAVIADLCAFLGIEPEVEAMVAMAAYESQDSSSFEGETARREYTGGIRTSDSVDRRSRLGHHERRVIAETCGPLADTLGYDLGEGSHTSHARRAGMHLDALGFQEAAETAGRYLVRRSATWLRRRLRGLWRRATRRHRREPEERAR